MTATERRWQVMIRLNRRRQDTINNLAEEFGVSYLTMLRDIHFLESMHPLDLSRGGGGGVRVMDGYYLGNRYLNTTQRTELERLLTQADGDSAEIIASILHDFALPGSPEGY